MADKLTPQQRSANMARIRSRHTTPELTVRRIVHSLGFRYRLHRRDLPGTPDLVLPKSKRVIFVNGCFWHRHPSCHLTSMPKSNVAFWEAKFERTVRRDEMARRALQELGWTVLTVWECETRDVQSLAGRLRKLLKSTNMKFS
ncbi:DNA mismatch endonuclease Vsr [Bradyrhizobium sp. 139]|nr:very short patch repair endonuclease [Bradyrhizobium sp. 139]MCK1744150.1 DNA mismatch endonuclease Vsr [Bradyrhizobium sp. 139]